MAVEDFLQRDLILATITVGFVTLVTIKIVSAIARFIKKFRYFQAFPGEPSYSIWAGNLHMLPATGEGRINYGRKNMIERNPKFARMWMGPFRANIVVYHPETAKVILKASADAAPKSRGFGQIYEMAVPWIGEGLISSNGSRWARSRRLLTPGFHFDILKNYMGIYNKAADTLIEILDKSADSGKSFDMCPPVTLCTLEIILKCAMGYEVDVQRKGHPYATAVREMLEAWSYRFRHVWLWPDFIFRWTSMGRKFLKNCDYVHKVAEEVIEKRKQLLEKEGPSKQRRLDFLDILLTARDEDGQPMTTLEIRNEVDTFMFAGHDTTATGAPWILYCLAKSPEYQKQIQEEVDAVLEGRDSDNIEWSDLAKFNILPLCVKEAMRLYPPVPFIVRTLNEDVEIEGKKIPAGTGVSLAFLHMHRNPVVWEDPDDFKPERFNSENMKGRDSFAYTPFSAGARNCIGQNFALNEEKVLVARILRRYNLELATDGPPVLRAPQAILKAEHGIWFRLKRRQI